MKNYISFIIVALLLVLLYFEFRPQKNIPESTITTSAVTDESGRAVDYRASFSIVTNGTLRNFSDPKYHNLSEEVYIQVDNPSIVHIKKSGATWNDFFKTLPMKVEPDCLTTGMGEKYCNGQGGKLNFYLNGKLVPNALTQEIKNEDKLLISYGYEEQIPNP